MTRLTRARLVSDEQLRDQVALALDEDIGGGDLTAALIPADACSDVNVVCRETAVICGRDWFDEVFRQLDANIHVDWRVEDGDHVVADSRICRLNGNTRAILSGERTALNFLQTLSGTASRAWRYAEQVADLDVRLLDTRKTLPGLRRAQKYAVRCGGCDNHRVGLFDAILIKENHIMAAGSISAAVGAARRLSPDVLIEVEVETLAELDEALRVETPRILLDNFSLRDLREAVSRTAGRAQLEASGGMTRERLREVAETGIDFISIGALTKDVRAVDLSMRFVTDA